MDIAVSERSSRHFISDRSAIAQFDEAGVNRSTSCVPSTNETLPRAQAKPDSPLRQRRMRSSKLSWPSGKMPEARPPLYAVLFTPPPKCLGTPFEDEFYSTLNRMTVQGAHS